MLKKILLASHDTPGARAAEHYAMAQAQAGAVIHHLVVVPDFWKGMMGDDWLNNAATQVSYGRYLETELGREIDVHIERLRGLLEAAGLDYTHEIHFGKPDLCLLAVAQDHAPDLVIMGGPRPKAIPGLRSRMLTERLLRDLCCPLTVIPYEPDES